MDITAVLTCHNEGLLLGPAAASFRAAIDYARAGGMTVEPLIIADNAELLTRSVVSTFDHSNVTVIETRFGDPGQTRNAAVNVARGSYISFLDGDDLWSHNWLIEAWRLSQAQSKPIVCHSEVNIVFGSARQMWWHADSESPHFDPSYLLIGNYWDSMCFAPTEIMRSYPFHPNDLSAGFGHEDWHWNQLTLGNGIPHRPVSNTVHFKRRRKGSQMAKCDEKDVITFFTPLAAMFQRPGTPPLRTRQDFDATAPSAHTIGRTTSPYVLHQVSGDRVHPGSRSH